MRGAGRGNPTRNLNRTDRRPAPPAHEYQRAARNGKTALSGSRSSTRATSIARPRVQDRTLLVGQSWRWQMPTIPGAASCCLIEPHSAASLSTAVPQQMRRLALSRLRSKPTPLSGGDPLCASSCDASAFPARPNARPGVDAQAPAFAVSHSVGPCHFWSRVSPPDCRSFIPFGRLSPLTVH